MNITNIIRVIFYAFIYGLFVVAGLYIIGSRKEFLDLFIGWLFLISGIAGIVLFIYLIITKRIE